MDWAVYLIYRAAAAAFSALSLRANFQLGRFLGSAAYCFALPYRRIVLHNLTIAFGGEKSPEELQKLAREHFATLGANLVCSIKVSSMTPEELREIITVENGEIIKESALNQGRGVIAVISHIGNWELFAQIMPVLFPGKLGSIYQRLGNPYIDAHVREMRERTGVQLFERKEGFNAATQLLRAPGIVGVLVDQHAGDAGVWAPFFGRLASTSSLAATLALRTGGLLIPMAIHTDGIAKWRMVVQPPIESGNRDSSALTAEINLALESQIRRAPEDWFWVHRRWKTPSPKFLLAHYKRGVQLPEGTGAGDLKPFRIVIRSSNWLGDAVMSVPAVRAIKAGRPDAHVTILAKSKIADFWKTVSAVDAVIEIGKSDTVFHVARKLRSGGFDVAVIFPNSVRSALEPFLAGIPRRVGFESRWRSALLNQLGPEVNKARPPEHHVQHYLRLAASIGAHITDWESYPKRMKPLPRSGSANNAPIKLGLCAGADYGPAKRWLPERFAEVAQTVASQRQCEWVLLGTAADTAIGEQIAGVLDGKCTNLIGKTSLNELITALSECRVLLTNDTGTMHLAAFLEVPTVSIFGSTEPALTGPLGERHIVLRHHVECSPCFLRECPIDLRCMKAVQVDEAVKAVLRQM